MQNPRKNRLSTHSWRKIKTRWSQHNQLTHQSCTKQNHPSPNSRLSRNQSLERRVCLSLKTKTVRIFQINRKASEISRVNSRSKKTLKKQLQRALHQNLSWTRIHEGRSVKNGQRRLGCQQSCQAVCQERQWGGRRSLRPGWNHAAKEQQIASGAFGRASVYDQERDKIK